MTDLKRRLSTQPLPQYIFIPGANPHPKKSGGHMEGLADPKAHEIDLHHPEQNSELAYALDLFNYGYYWESHVYFEALWNAHQRSGAVSDLMKAFIKLGAAGVKLSIDQKESARGHFERALELISSVMTTQGRVFLGFDLTLIHMNIKTALSQDLQIFDIYPDW